MLPDWINYMFEASQLSNINANDQQVLKKYKCPPFHQLTICTTGITSNKEKGKLAELIKANGNKTYTSFRDIGDYLPFIIRVGCNPIVLIILYCVKAR